MRGSGGYDPNRMPVGSPEPLAWWEWLIIILIVIGICMMSGAPIVLF